MNNDIWNRRFLELAILISNWSKDPSSKVGAVIIDENRRIVSTGYNGLAKNVHDDSERLENRELKYKLTLHAEENAILFARRDLTNCSIYISEMPPCSHCAALIIQSGITDVYAPNKPISERWVQSVELTKTMFQEAGVRLHFV